MSKDVLCALNAAYYTTLAIRKGTFRLHGELSPKGTGLLQPAIRRVSFLRDGCFLWIRLN